MKKFSLPPSIPSSRGSGLDIKIGNTNNMENNLNKFNGLNPNFGYCLTQRDSF